MNWHDDILNHQANQRLNILKGFVEVEDELMKAKNRKVGEMHPNGKWVWKEYAPGKFDWRGAKASDKTGGASASGKTDSGTGGASNSPRAQANRKDIANQNQKEVIANAVKKVRSEQTKLEDELSSVLWDRKSQIETVGHVSGHTDNKISKLQKKYVEITGKKYVLGQRDGGKKSPDKVVASAKSALASRGGAAKTSPLLKQSSLSSSEFQQAKKLEGFKKENYRWNGSKDLWDKVEDLSEKKAPPIKPMKKPIQIDVDKVNDELEKKSYRSGGLDVDFRLTDKQKDGSYLLQVAVNGKRGYPRDADKKAMSASLPSLPAGLEYVDKKPINRYSGKEITAKTIKQDDDNYDDRGYQDSEFYGEASYKVRQTKK